MMNEKEKSKIKKRLLDDLFDKAIKNDGWKIHGSGEIVHFTNNGKPKNSLCRIEPRRNLILINSFLFMVFPFDKDGDSPTLKRNLVEYVNELNKMDIIGYRSGFEFKLFTGNSRNKIKNSNNEFIRRKYVPVG